eukprot:scaffold9585_cov103-Skeletonema_marinoi.AAC.4
MLEENLRLCRAQGMDQCYYFCVAKRAWCNNYLTGMIFSLQSPHSSSVIVVHASAAIMVQDDGSLSLVNRR